MYYVKRKTDKRCIVDVSLSGYKEEDVKVTAGVDGKNTITVKAKMKTSVEDNRSLGYYKIEKANSPNKQIIEIDDRFEVEEAKVTFDNGLMRIDVPKKEEYFGRVIHPSEEEESESEE